MSIDMFSIVNNIIGPILNVFWILIRVVLAVAGGAVAAFALVFLIRYPFYAKKGKAAYLEGLSIHFKWYDLIRWKLWDYFTAKEAPQEFSTYGFTIFVGRQGAGKTLSMVKYLNDMKEKYPECVVVTNFAYSGADRIMKDWRDLFEVRNGTKGVIFAIDEIHSEYSSEAWKDFPESLLSEISQQRKQRVKIVATSQVYSRVAKPIREQAFTVVCCDTYLCRLTRNREYDAAEYGVSSDSPYIVKKRCKPVSKNLFVQTNALRRCYDTYEKVERMKKVKFIPRAER